MSTLRVRRVSGSVGDMKIDGRGRLRIRFTLRKGLNTALISSPKQNEEGEMMVAGRRH